MRKPIILLLGIAALVLFLCVKNNYLSRLKENDNDEKEKAEQRGESEDEESGVDKQMAYWYYARAYPDPFYLDDKYANAWRQAQEIRKNQQNLNTKIMSGGWTSIGPSTGIGGRILNIAINPVKTTSIFVGSAGGGIWKSYDGANTWQPVTTSTGVMGVPAVIISSADTNVMYAGTGEVYRYDSTGTTAFPNNTGYSVWKTRGTYGVGIIKSTDGGKTWSQVFTKSLANLFGIQRMKFDPTNNNIVYACATDGLYKTTDAGATWNRIFIAPYVSDVVIDARDNNQVVVAYGNFENVAKGIAKSTDGGVSFAKISSASFPATTRGFIRFDNVPLSGQRDTIVASIGVDETGSPNEIFRSTDFGSTWSALSGSTHTSYQFWCAHTIAIDPHKSDSLIYAGVNLYVYKISSAAGTQIGTTVHADFHDIKFDPSNTKIIYAACDGGIWKTTNGGTNWSSMNNGLAATQFYASIGVSTTDPNFYVGGLQDNGVVYYNGSTWTGYVNLTSIDGAACAVNPRNDDTVLTSGDAKDVYWSNTKTTSSSNVLAYWGAIHDSRTAFNTPMAISPKKPTVAYVGSDELHKSTTGGSSFTINTTTPGTSYIEALHKTAITMAVSPTDPNGDTLYVSTSPFAQYDNDADNIYITGSPNLLKSTNGGSTLPLTSIMGTLPNRFVLDMAISKTRSDSIFVTLGGFGTAHVYVSPDKGTTWNALSTTGLPDCPFNAILIDPVNPQVIYVGTDMGVYVSPNRGSTWYDFNTGLWDAVQVMDLQATASNMILAATHGKGAFLSARYSGVLPVKINSFTGSAEGDYNKLSLTVDGESEMAYYNVERSIDGNTFSKIGTIYPNNNYSSTTYVYKDQGVGNKSYYYRIKAVNRDQSYTYSSNVYISRNSSESMNVLGNPFKDKIQLSIKLIQQGSATLNLFDGGGKLIKTEHIDMNSGQNFYTLGGLSGITAGVYYVEAIVNKNHWKVRLIKN